MDRDTLAETIFARFAAPYGDAITPALTQQLRISANLAAEDILEQITEALSRKKWKRVMNPTDLSPEEVDERNVAIAEAYMSGKSLREVGEQFDMGHTSVCAILDHLGIERRPPGRPTPIPPRSRVIAMKRVG